MIRGGFLSADERQALMALARDGLAEHRLARRANAIVLLDKGWSCAKVAGAFLLDDDTVRGWFNAYQRNGLTGLSEFGHEGSACRLTDEQQTALKAWVAAHLPRSTNMIGAWLKETYGLDYSHAGLIALLHRLGLEYCKPRRIPRHLDEARQQAFIDKYEKLLNGLDADESVVFVDAVHPTPSGAPGRLLGAERHDACGRADHRPSELEHPWRHRFGDRGDRDAGGPQGHRGELDFIACGSGSRACMETANPRFPRQCELSSRRQSAGLAQSAGAQVRAALHPAILSPPQSH